MIKEAMIAGVLLVGVPETNNPRGESLMGVNNYLFEHCKHLQLEEKLFLEMHKFTAMLRRMRGSSRYAQYLTKMLELNHHNIGHQATCLRVRLMSKGGVVLRNPLEFVP